MSKFNGSVPIKPGVAYTDALAEPGPDWPVSKKIWGVAWGMHWIGFGILFGLLAVHSFFAIVNKRKGFSRKPLFIAINLLLFVLGATRSVYLLLDPYESRQNGVKDPKWLTLLLFGIAYPCLTSSFCLIHLAFLEVSKLQIGLRRLQSVKFLTTVMSAHFIIVFTAETTSSIKPELKALLIFCQSFFIHFYSMIGVYGMYSEVVHPSPWPWLAFQSSFRFVELAMACTIAYSVIQREKTPKKGKTVSAHTAGVMMEPRQCDLKDIKESHIDSSKRETYPKCKSSCLHF